MERRFIIMLGQKVARTTIGAIRAVAGSQKTLNNATILYNINIRPRVLTMENAALEKCNEYASKTKEFCQRKVEQQFNTFTEKSRECVSNAQTFYQQKVEPKLQKAKSIAKTEYGEYKKEIKNSLEIHMPLEFISESLPAKYRTLFITTMAPISHIAKKAAEEREDLNRQKFKTEAGNELKATLMTEGVLFSWKNLRKFCFTYWFMSSHWQLAACWLQSEKKFLLWDSSALPWTGVLIPSIWI